MSEDARCDECGAVGRRRRMRMCPEGWFYGESADDETGAVMVIMVCSEKCKGSFFKPGPGRLTDANKKEAGPH